MGKHPNDRTWWERVRITLGAPDPHPRILSQQAGHLRSHVVSAPLSSLMLAVLLVVLAHPQAESTSLWTWGGILGATLALRLILGWIHPETDAGVRAWILGFQWLTTATGLVWGLTILAMPEDNLTLQVVTLLIACGVVMAVLPLLAVVEHAYSTYVVVTLSPLVLVLLLWGDRFHFVLGVMIAAFLFTMLRSARLVSGIFTTSLRQRLHEAERAIRDPVTGIANRRRFEDVLQEQWRHAQHIGRPLSLLMIDIDEFKAYNDHYGHLQGDACLRRVAEALSTALRGSAGLVARYGGEEFVVLLPGIDAQDARRVAERMLRAVQQLDIAHPQSPVCPHVTVSVGGATAIPDPTKTSDRLVQAADQALYAAKQHGKDRIGWIGTAGGPASPRQSAP